MSSVEDPDQTEPTVSSSGDISTGHAEIDAAMLRLRELDGLPVDRHGEILDELHGQLRDVLAAAASPSGGSDD
jgi:hypothetical protein